MHLGLALTFAEDPKIFITKTGCKPHLKVLSADLYGLCCILEQSSLIQIHQKLASSSMQFSYKRQSCKPFSVEQGYVQSMNLSLCTTPTHTHTHTHTHTLSHTQTHTNARLTVGWNCMKSTHLIQRQKPLSHELGSAWMGERANERTSAAERASEASSTEKANEWAVRADERVAQYSMRRFHSHSTYRATETS